MAKKILDLERIQLLEHLDDLSPEEFV